MNGPGQDSPSRESSGFPAIGTRLPSRARTVTETDITMFAALTGDWHPQHSDVEWAKSSFFGERIAHGLLVLSFTFGLVELDRERVIALRRLQDVVFKRPTHIGETIRVHALVESVRRIRADIALLGLGWRVVNSGEKTVLRAQVEVLYRASLSGQTPPSPADDDDDLVIPGVIPF